VNNRRLIANILFGALMMQCVLIAAFIVGLAIQGDREMGFGWLIADTVVLLVSVSVFLASLMLRQNHKKQQAQITQHFGGEVRALFKRGYWHNYLALYTPYAPSWMRSVFWCSILVPFMMLLYLSRLYGVPHSDARTSLTLLALPISQGMQALPFIYSNWREQALRSVSPIAE
jgi:hypothetical protein